jgi:vacuolar protein sorting-associated protein 13A/C
LFTNVSSGVADIFYEPFNGAVMHGNHDLGIGIAKVRLTSEAYSLFHTSDVIRELPASSRRRSSVFLIA